MARLTERGLREDNTANSLIRKSTFPFSSILKAIANATIFSVGVRLCALKSTVNRYSLFSENDSMDSV